MTLDATWTVTNVDAQTVEHLASQHTPDAQAVELGVDLIRIPTEKTTPATSGPAYTPHATSAWSRPDQRS